MACVNENAVVSIRRNYNIIEDISYFIFFKKFMKFSSLIY